MRAHALVILAASVMFTGCPKEGVLCAEGLSPCSDGCRDLSSDDQSCGTCGRSCDAGNVCQSGECICRGEAVRCAGSCVTLAYDVRHCGACGDACLDNEVCSRGRCAVSCEAGLVQCGRSCVDVRHEPEHCGACGERCPTGQRCRDGQCGYDVVAACRTNGLLVGFEALGNVRGPAMSIGTTPAVLATLGHSLLVADDTDQRLLQASLRTLAPWDVKHPVGQVPNHILVELPHVYVVNAGTGSVQILAVRGESSAGPYAFEPVAEYALGPNTYPEAAALFGGRLYVPLYGGFGDAAKHGGRVVELDVQDPSAPKLARTFDLNGLNLRAFPGKTTVPRPFAIIERRGKLYIPLSNLNPQTYAPDGPGLLAVLSPAGGKVDLIDLGADVCLNPVWVGPFGEGVAVSCAGRAFDESFAPIATEKTGVVVLDGQDRPVAAWNAVCHPDDASCPPPSLGRFAAFGRRLYVGDQAAGRVFVVEQTGAGLAAKPPLSLCPVNATTGYSNVADMVTLP